ncbi:MAG: MFS transporter [Methylacidiphilales bacterium]|nr:MFS transporter [Candidatus Methylacidiphilales bacterium]
MLNQKLSYRLHMSFLGFSCGLPYGLVFSTTVIWLKELGVSMTNIGLISGITLIYAIKFTYSPLCDWSPVKTSHTQLRKYWIIFCQVLIGLLLHSISVNSIGETFSIVNIVVLLLLLGFVSTLQDMSVDAWRIECPEYCDQGVMITLYQVGYRFGLLLSSSVSLILVSWYSWDVLFDLIGIIILFLALIALYLPYEKNAQVIYRTMQPINACKQLYLNLIQIAERKWRVVIFIILLIMFYRISDLLIAVMARPFFMDLGYSKIQIGSASAVALYIILIGNGIGALIIKYCGLYTSMWIGGLLAALSNAVYLMLYVTPVNSYVLFFAMSIENFCTGIASTSLIAFMSLLVQKESTATHYAVVSSFSVLIGKIIATQTGWVVELYGYKTLFIGSMVSIVPVLLFLKKIKQITILRLPKN